MKKDVVLLVMDSLGADEFDDEKYGVTSVPGIKKMMAENTYLSQYYSQGSHTESALPGLICGIDTLDYNAYLRRFNDKPKTIFDFFIDEGYQAINISWGRNMLPKRIRDKVTNYYTAGFSFCDALFFIIPYYKKLYDLDVMTEKDKAELIECYEDAFEGCMKFWDRSRNVEHAYDLMGDTVTEGYECVLKTYAKEYELFKIDRWEYIESDLRRGQVTDVMSDNHIDPNLVLDREKLGRIKRKYSKLIKYLKQKQIKSILSDRRLDYPELVKMGVQRILGKNNLYLSNWYAKWLSTKQYDFDRVDKLRDDGASLQTQLEFLEKILKEKSDTPRFIYMHVNTVHPPVEWIAFDKDEKIIEMDIKRAIKLAKNTKGFHGDLIFRIGMGYADRCIYEFYRRLKKNKMLDDMILSITADHGSVIGSRPVRKSRVANNCHSEAYHVPMIIIDKEKKFGRIDGFYESIDYLPTILELCGIYKGAGLKGSSFFDDKEKSEIVHMERIDTGAPCLEHRNAIYVARNDRYIVEYEVGVYQNFEDGVINEVYNIKEDPDELRNIAGKIDIQKIKSLLTFIERRHEKLQKNYKIFCEDKYVDFDFDKPNWRQISWNPRE